MRGCAPGSKCDQFGRYVFPVTNAFVILWDLNDIQFSYCGPGQTSGSYFACKSVSAAIGLWAF